MRNLSKKLTLKNQSGFIRVSSLITIIVGILILGGGGYFGIKKYQGYQMEKVEKTKLADENKKIEEERQLKLQKLLDSQSEELGKQKLEIDALKNKSSTIINSQNKTSELSQSDIIAQWTSKIAYIVCSFSITDSKTIANLRRYGVDTDPEVLAGSGLVRSIQTRHSQSPIVAIITNRHVLSGHHGFSYPTSCEVTLPGNHKYTFAPEDSYFQTIKGEEDNNDVKFIDGQPYVVPETDAGFLWVRNPDQYIQSIATKSKLCEILPRIGDDVVILGYPGIGADTGITATDGIISGIEDKYFVTSAKVEHGNSGGAAIYKDQNCYFGIPTFVRTGTVESLARILNFQKTFAGGY